MEMIAISIPYDYAASKSKLSWREISWAINQEILAPYAAREHAIASLKTVDDCSDDLIELAYMKKSDSVRGYLDELANLENEQSVDIIEKKWLYLLLSWIYDSKASFEDPLEVVELVYAEFDYPSIIKAFVRYMPSDEPSLGSVELNTARMFDKWHDYLVSQGRLFNVV